jgi:acyl-CoA thioester hydrolase
MSIHPGMDAAPRIRSTSPPMTRTPPPRRAAFRRFHPISTRWMDNDVFGHLNNVVYYSLFDTAVNAFLLERDLIEIRGTDPVFVVVETMCRYHRELAYPDQATVGLRVGRIGSSSVRYELGVFRNDEEEAAADGHFVHVLVKRGEMRPLPIPPAMRAALAELE